MLLEEDFLKKLENLRLLQRYRVQGRPGGLHLSARTGISLEFAEYKKYFPGDDFRYVDWNIYGRLDKLFIKVFAREEDVPIYIILDSSRSMGLGKPSKLEYAKKLAGALSYLGLKDLNRVGIFPFSTKLNQGVFPKGGMSQLFKIFSFLEGIKPQGETALSAALDHLAQRRLEAGLAVLISDLFSTDGYQGISHLLYKGFEVVILQILAEEDLQPKIEGETELVDVEDEKRLHVGPDAKQLYLKALNGYIEEIKSFCLHRHIKHFLISTAVTLEVAVFEILRKGAFIK
jgi:uncharacterized protein (DUF58 family)